jgi:UDP-2,4-diacetamido-2,4,6-trideoxy-beta-L-altropyranose hydrolase
MSAPPQKEGPRILFVCDAGPDVGGGHVMRSLTLAGALADAGAECAFLARPAVEAVLDAFAPTTARTVAAEPFDAVVFDHYGLAAPDHRACAKGRPTLVIDDLANRPLEADLVLDAGPARRAEDYAGLTPPGAVLLLGPNHAPVRPAFAALRDQALARRAAGGAVGRILISLGLTDVGGVTGRVVDLLLPRIGDIALDVVLGSGAPSLARLRTMTDPRLTLHVDTQDMPRLTLEADLAVGAGGSTSWERCILALPTLTLVLADNQVAAATALEAAGASPSLDVGAPDFDEAFGAQIARLIGDAALRASLSAASAQVCDGGGAARVTAALLTRITRA